MLSMLIMKIVVHEKMVDCDGGGNVTTKNKLVLNGI